MKLNTCEINFIIIPYTARYFIKLASEMINEAERRQLIPIATKHHPSFLFSVLQNFFRATLFSNQLFVTSLVTV